LRSASTIATQTATIPFSRAQSSASWSVPIGSLYLTFRRFASSTILVSSVVSGTPLADDHALASTV